MDKEKLNKALAGKLSESTYRDSEFGEYHPSTISGCPVMAVLDRMIGSEFVMNSYTFAGSAVHYYLQETGILTDALYDAGYHPLYTEYEVHTRKRITDGIYITGTCDVLCDNGDKTTIFDLKYSSLKPEYAQGRVMQYFSQVNTYSYMFDADEMALWLISSNERDNLPKNGLTLLTGTPQEDNWEVVKNKAKQIHKTLEMLGYDEGRRITESEAKEYDKSDWEDMFKHINLEYAPSYDKEHKYCDHKEYCPICNDVFATGMEGFVANNGA